MNVKADARATRCYSRDTRAAIIWMQVLDQILAIICESRDEVDLQLRIKSFKLVPVNATAYCLHVATNFLAFIEGVRIFDN